MAAVKVTPPNDFPLGLIRSHMVVIHLFLMLCDLQMVIRDLCPTLYIYIYLYNVNFNVNFNVLPSKHILYTLVKIKKTLIIPILLYERNNNQIASLFSHFLEAQPENWIPDPGRLHKKLMDFLSRGHKLITDFEFPWLRQSFDHNVCFYAQIRHSSTFVCPYH
jgi:hypothetical protein